jgi:clan AA aspartic protease
MNGFVDDSGRALLEIQLKPSEADTDRSLMAWIDTGFTGDLVLPQQSIEELALQLSGTVRAVLADGTMVTATTYSCLIRWFDGWQHLEVVASQAKSPLLGVGMLLDRELRIDYRSKELSLT